MNNNRINRIKRAKTAYLIISNTFGKKISPIFTGILINILRYNVSFYMMLDKVFYKRLRKDKIKSPILIFARYSPAETILPLLLVAFHFIDLGPDVCLAANKFFIRFPFISKITILTLLSLNNL